MPGLRFSPQRWYRTDHYQRRRAKPAVLLVSSLLVLVVITWSVVLSGSDNDHTGALCPPTPLAGQSVGEPQPADALDEVAPAAPNAVRIRVLNGSGQRGQANLVASQLGELGFTEAADPSNDPFYPNGELRCRGNIRYGEQGASAARTVSLVLPCVPLVRDNRTDDSVDVAVGVTFGEVNPSRATREVLDQLSGPSGRADTTNGTAATPSVDPEMLEKARAAQC